MSSGIETDSTVAQDVAASLKSLGARYLFCFPTHPLINAAAEEGIRPIVCRQERVGVNMADGFARLSDDDTLSIFAMQSGPGAENAFGGVATAYADSVPLLVMPLGYPTSFSGDHRTFRSEPVFAHVTKRSRAVTDAASVRSEIHSAVSFTHQDVPGPVLLEIPEDIYQSPLPPDRFTSDVRVAHDTGKSMADAIARELADAARPLILAGQGILSAAATEDLVALAEALPAPVVTTLNGKGAFPENHGLSLGTVGGSLLSDPAKQFLEEADLLIALGAGLVNHAVTGVSIPDGLKIVQVRLGEVDRLDLDRPSTLFICDLRTALPEVIEELGSSRRPSWNERDLSIDIRAAMAKWKAQWEPLLNSTEKPITPYRVVKELDEILPADKRVVTHDSGSPRRQMVPFVRAIQPGSYIGWGKSHSLGTGLGLIIGAKLARPESICVNVMGDAAFGMVGLDFETSVREEIPIITVVLNNSTMACEATRLAAAHERFGVRNLGGQYADIARALGGIAYTVTEPEQIASTIKTAISDSLDGQSVLIEVTTSEELR